MQELVDVVDENDKIVGQDFKDNCHKLGKWHRSVAIYVLKEGKLILQVRAHDKKIEPGVFDHSASGHVSAGDSYEESGKRELEEELGIVAPLEFIGSCRQDTKYPTGLMDRQIFHVFAAKHDGDFKIQESELADAKLFDVEEVKSMLKQIAKFAQGFQISFPVFYKWYKAQSL